MGSAGRREFFARHTNKEGRFAMRGLAVAGLVLLVAGGAEAADHQVTMNNMKFSPAKVNAKLGDTITFINNDTDDHDVYSSTAGFGINLPNVTKGGGKQVMALKKAGRFDVECGIHPDMLV